MFHNMDYVYCVYKEKSFSKAAERLHISQPSLSSTIKRLEQELGVPLFEKKGRNIVLSEYGKIYPTETIGVLYQYLKAIFHSEQKMMDLIHSLIYKVEDYNLTNNNQSLKAGYLCYFLYENGLYSEAPDEFSIEIDNTKYICQRVHEPSELNISYKLTKIEKYNSSVMNYSIYEILYKALDICSRIYRDGEISIP